MGCGVGVVVDCFVVVCGCGGVLGFFVVVLRLWFL